MAESDNNTATYGASDNDRTERYNSKEQTGTYPDLMNKEFRQSTLLFGIGDKLNIQGIDYVIKGVISKGTGEADIYEIVNANKEIYALKLYQEYSERDRKREPNYEALSRISKITDEDILKLHWFGARNNVKDDRYLGKYCFEISEFAEGGDLLSVGEFKKKYSVEFIEQEFIPQIFKGLKKLHRNKLYHCDLKPSNIFFRDKEQVDLVIGDYGSTKAYDIEIDKEVIKSSTVIGTTFYMAPEQPRGFISEKLDYYSFGIILLQLIYPGEIARDEDPKTIDKIKFEIISERQYNQQSVLPNFKSELNRLNKLIEGLTLFSPQSRWGLTEVERWLNGENIEVKYRATEISSVQPIKLGYATIKTDKDFINVLEADSKWYEDLIEPIDEKRESTFTIWLDSYRNMEERKVIVKMIKFYQPLGKDYVKESLLRYFDPEREIRIDMSSFNFFSSNNIKNEVDAYISKLDDIWKITGIDKLRFYIFQLEFSLQQVKKLATGESLLVLISLVDKIYSAFGLVQKPFDEFKTELQIKFSSKDQASTFRSLINLFYAFNPQRTFRDLKNNSFKTIVTLGLFYVQNESMYADNFLKVEREKFLDKLGKNELNTIEYKPFIFEIFKDDAEANVELVHLTFDKHRNYTVDYKFFKSLNSFLKNNNISSDFTSRSEQDSVYQNQRQFFQSFKSEGEKFITTVCREHSIASLTNNNLSKIRSRFIGDSWQRYLYVYWGQFLSFLLLLPIILGIYKVATHQLHFDTNWKPFSMTPNDYNNKVQADYAAEQKKMANDAASNFVSNVNIQGIHLFELANGASSAKNNRNYVNQFSLYSPNYVYCEVDFSHKDPEKHLTFGMNYIVYDKNNNIAFQGGSDSYVESGWTNSNHTILIGEALNSGKWMRGDYRVELFAYGRNLGTQNFSIIGNSSSTNKNRHKGNSSNRPFGSLQISMGEISFNYAPIQLGLGYGAAIIKLVSAYTTASNITLTFTMKALNQENTTFMYNPKYLKADHGWNRYYDYIPPYIQDDNGKIYYSTDGFIGGEQKEYSSGYKLIYLKNNEELTLTINFPMISAGSPKIRFVCPGTRGHQSDWTWDNIYLIN